MGEYEHSIDSKGRAVVPSKFRDELDESFIITKGIDKCLFIYTQNDWKNFEEKVKKLPMADPNVRRFIRYMFSGACECSLDNQGRINIPLNLRKHAEIIKDIVSIGAAGRIEIWSMENWSKYNEENNVIDDELAEKMAELGI